MSNRPGRRMSTSRSRTPVAVLGGVCTALVLSACDQPSVPAVDRAEDTGQASAASSPNTVEPAPSEVAAETSAPAGTSAKDTVPARWPDVIDPTAIPLGDGMISTEPEAGSLWSCKTDFGGRGAPHGGPWIDEEAGTWDFTAKLAVARSDSWPQAGYEESVQGD